MARLTPEQRRAIAELLRQKDTISRRTNLKVLAAENHVSVTTMARFASAVRSVGYDAEAAVAVPITWRRP